MPARTIEVMTLTNIAALPLLVHLHGWTDCVLAPGKVLTIGLAEAGGEEGETIGALCDAGLIALERYRVWLH